MSLSAEPATQKSIIESIPELPDSELNGLLAAVNEASKAGNKELNGISIFYLCYEIEKERSRRREVQQSKRSFTLRELMTIDFPPLLWYAEGLLTTGLTLLWGYAKTGKSILSLHLLLAVAQGGRALGHLPVKKAGVLLISLEDGPRRLQTRLKNAGALPEEGFTIFCDWPRADKGIERLEKYLSEHPEIKVVCIDTLFLFSKIKDGNDYSETTEVMERLKRIADARDICIIAVHHSRKMGKDSGDMIETALGSTGIVAGPDHLLYLKRTPSGPADAELHFRSKDADGQELALRFNRDIGGWELIGDARDLADTDERQEILDLLKKEGALKTGKIAELLDKKVNAVSNLIHRMVEKEQLRKLAYGLYAPPGEYDTPPKTPCKPCKCESTTQDTQKSFTLTRLSGGVVGVDIPDDDPFPDTPGEDDGIY